VLSLCVHNLCVHNAGRSQMAAALLSEPPWV